TAQGKPRIIHDGNGNALHDIAKPPLAQEAFEKEGMAHPLQILRRDPAADVNATDRERLEREIAGLHTVEANERFHDPHGEGVFARCERRDLLADVLLTFGELDQFMIRAAKPRRIKIEKVAETVTPRNDPFPTHAFEPFTQEPEQRDVFR